MLDKETLFKIQQEFSKVQKIKRKKYPTSSIKILCWIICPLNKTTACKKGRWVYIDELRRQVRNGGLGGRCRHCAQFEGGTITRTGYRRIHINGNTYFEHRRILEEYLGRKLRKGETVHHGPGGRADNRIENLELRVAGKHPTGLSANDMIKWLENLGCKVIKSTKLKNMYNSKGESDGLSLR